MFWDHISGIYDIVETVYNARVYQSLGKCVAAEISPDDRVLECACGTGAISKYIAPNCRQLTATDYSVGMLQQTAKKCAGFSNVRLKRADITSLKCRDNYFDCVVAGNVIHLLDDPVAAVQELVRVCKPGGTIIIPTYINLSQGRTSKAARLFELCGVEFKRQFDAQTYRQFFAQAGFPDARFTIVDGRMPCAIAILNKHS